MITKELLDILDLIMKDAKDKASAAGYQGSYGDGGAAILEAQVRFFRYGWDHSVPPEWEKYKRQAIKEADPEYLDYLRLSQKFGGK